MNAATLVEQPNGRFWAAMSIVCASFASVAGWTISAGNWVLAIPFALAIAGIARRVRWARRLSLVLGWLALITGFALMFPVEKGMEVPGEVPVPVEVVVAEAIVVCSMALVCLHLLGVYRKSFRAAWF